MSSVSSSSCYAASPSSLCWYVRNAEARRFCSQSLFKWIPEIPSWGDAAFSGFFGPMGVGAIFYVQVSLEALHHTNRDRLTA